MPTPLLHFTLYPRTHRFVALRIAKDSLVCNNNNNNNNNNNIGQGRALLVPTPGCSVECFSEVHQQLGHSFDPTA